ADENRGAFDCARRGTRPDGLLDHRATDEQSIWFDLPLRSTLCHFPPASAPGILPKPSNNFREPWAKTGSSPATTMSRFTKMHTLLFGERRRRFSSPPAWLPI